MRQDRGMKPAMRRTRGRRRSSSATFPVLMAVLTAVTLCACTSGSAPALTATKKVHVSPVRMDGTPVSGFRTTQTVAGANCEAGSEAIGLAYRCFAGNFVYDPCWAERAATPTVLCLPVPWSVTDVRLQVSAPLSAIPAEPGTTSEPWGLELASGQRCVMVQGAHSVFKGRVIDYYCNSGLSLLRGLTTSSAVWTAASVTGSAGTQAPGPSEQIKIAWYGIPDSYR
jgi:hypothetical protein